MSASQLESLTVTLTTLYKRPNQTVSDYAEEFTLAQVARRPGVMDELAEIMAFRQRLPAKERRYFPNSLYKLLVNWQETLDRARVYEPNPQERSLAANQADRFIRRMQQECGV